MNKKTIVALVILTFSCFTTFSQENESVLSAPDNWKSEIIPFPIGFAPAIDFVGFEDLRFAPGWNKPGSVEYWTYSFVWYIEKYGAMTENKLSESINSYYDGLMGIDMKNQADTTGSNQLDRTLCLFVKTNEGFTGKIRVYDAFFMKDYMTLNIKVKESFCANTNKQIILFDISPKAFDHDVWGIFDDVKLKVKCD